MIDVKTGHLLIDNKRTITPKTSFATIEQWQLGITQKTRQMGGGWSCLDVKNLNIDKRHLNISFLFNDKGITGFTFTFQELSYSMNPNWASWSKEGEKTNLDRFNYWLNQQFGNTRKLEWGTVHAFYDPKSAGSFIKLNYA
ncbi:MAG: hypothetical protein ACI85I_002609 [Arenicella sp.]|jgi:hypothetical protein